MNVGGKDISVCVCVCVCTRVRILSIGGEGCRGNNQLLQSCLCSCCRGENIKADMWRVTMETSAFKSTRQCKSVNVFKWVGVCVCVSVCVSACVCVT